MKQITPRNRPFAGGRRAVSRSPACGGKSSREGLCPDRSDAKDLQTQPTWPIRCERVRSKYGGAAFSGSDEPTRATTPQKQTASRFGRFGTPL